MGLASALSTALTGLKAAETVIDVAGNNVANSNTVGFKGSEAVFASQFLQTQGLGSAPTSNRGGTNPPQIGLGTKVAEITPDFTQGTIEISSNPSDLAIQGDGFFIVEGTTTGEQFYTRNGIFKTNSENDLVTINGQRLLGYGIDENFVVQETSLTSINIPLGSKEVSQVTQNVFLEGTLPPSGPNVALADTAEIIQSAVLSDGSVEIPADLASSSISAVAPAVVTAVTGTAAAGGSLTSGGTYNYKIVSVDADGNEGPPSSATVTTTVSGGNLTVDLANLPAAAAGFTGKNIYRSDSSGGGTYTLVNNTPIGAAATTFSDDGSFTGGNLNDATLVPGNYSYYITFYNQSTLNESRPTSLIGPVNLAAAGRRIRMTNLPLPTSGGVFDGVNIYRSLSNDSTTYRLIASLPSPSTTTTFIDRVDDTTTLAGAAINLDGPTISGATNLVDIRKREATNYTTPFQTGTLQFTGRKGGRLLSQKTLAITSTTTVQNLIDFMDYSMGIQNAAEDVLIPGTAGASIFQATRLQFESNRGVDNALEVGLSALQIQTASGTVGVNLGFTSTQTAVGATTVTDFVAFDSLGNSVNVRLTLALESTDGQTTTYRWFADSSDNDPPNDVDIAAGTGLVTFDGEGNFISTTSSQVAIERSSIPATDLIFKLDFTQISGLAGDIGVAASRQDGSPPGKLTSFIIGEDGNIRGVFSNGIARDLGQIVMARFANNSGLVQHGENLFTSGVNSGLPILGKPGESGIGSIIAGAVELSNTDIGQNLIDLILASTQYRGGTRVITSVQQLFDELLNLRR